MIVAFQVLNRSFTKISKLYLKTFCILLLQNKTNAGISLIVKYFQ